jgi:hypothetical protein
MDLIQFMNALLSEHREYVRNLDGGYVPLETFLIQRMHKDHKKAVQIAGDLGQAYSKIGDLERELGRGKL